MQIYFVRIKLSSFEPRLSFVEPGFEANNYHDHGQKFALKVIHVRAIEPYVKIHRLIAHGCQELGPIPSWGYPCVSHSRDRVARQHSRRPRLDNTASPA